MKLKINNLKLKDYKRIDKTIIIVSYLLLIIPIFLWLTFWFKWYISLICDSLLIIGSFFVFKNIEYKSLNEYRKILDIKKIIIIFSLLLFINILSGSGGITHQNWDYKFRNVVLSDLINNDWPVKYDYSNLEYEKSIIGSDQGLLSYYYAYFLPSAVVGKLFGFAAASLFSLLYQTLMCYSFFYLIFRKMNRVKIRYLIVFLCFGGLDIIAGLFSNHLLGTSHILIGTSHIDTVNPYFVMSSFITQLFWVFNQSLPAWIITMLIVNEKKYENLGFMISILLPFAPFPCIGLILYSFIVILFGFDYDEFINNDRIKKLFSIQNILSVISVIPIGLIFLQNQNNKGLVILRAIQNGNINKVLIGLLLFIVFEFGFYILIVDSKNKKKIFMYFALFLLMSMFYFGDGLDFINRASIPILVLLFLEVIVYLDNSKDSIKRRLFYILLFFCFCTNINEFRRSFEETNNHLKNGRILKYNNPFKTYATFENKQSSEYVKNFVCSIKDNYLNKIIK